MQIENPDGFGDVDLYYSHFYSEVVFKPKFGGLAINKTHKDMERKYSNKHFSSVLEIGVGHGEHFGFVKHSFDSYHMCDIRESINQNLLRDSRVSFTQADVEFLPFSDNYYDRVIVTCLLHHLNNPEKAMQEILRVLKPGGTATILLSGDPGLTTRILRKLTIARSARSRGYQGYLLYIARDHKNHISSLLEIMRFVFRDEKISFRYLPFRIPSWNLNAYIICDLIKASV
jgi:phosphatidylethanolamine/phosphatidyl-N-methylethanolamine N-methyltransferase